MSIMFQVEYRDRSKDLLKRRCRIVNADISEDEIETMLDEGKTQMFNASILEDTTKAREQLNELKGKNNRLWDGERYWLMLKLGVNNKTNNS